MTYGMLLWPHANARYQQSVMPLAVSELTLLLSAAKLESDIRVQMVAGVSFLCFDAPSLTDRAREILMTHSQLYLLAEMRGDGAVFPLFTRADAYLQHDLPGILKYKGKTNESFTHLLTNLALYSSRFSEKKEKLSLLDPMCGRGTTLFDAVNRGFDATGIDMDAADIDEAYNFFTRYMEYHRYKHQKSDVSLTTPKGKGLKVRRISFANTPEAFKAKEVVSLSLARGDSAEVVAAFPKKSFHLVVADLPYGVQHAPGAAGKMSPFDKMLSGILRGCSDRMLPGGAVALSFNTHTLKTEFVRNALQSAGLEPLSGGIYDGLEHWVEQAVMRDAAIGIKRP